MTAPRPPARRGAAGKGAPKKKAADAPPPVVDAGNGRVVAYTDGACSGNPGPGGWGVVLRWNGHERELYGGETLTTNNRMELTAAAAALESLKRRVPVDLVTDSEYVRNGILSWIDNWKRNGWKTADRKPVKNADLWQRLDAARKEHDVVWHWVRGHAGNPDNERADELARQGIADVRAGATGGPT